MNPQATINDTARRAGVAFEKFKAVAANEWRGLHPAGKWIAGVMVAIAGVAVAVLLVVLALKFAVLALAASLGIGFLAVCAAVYFLPAILAWKKRNFAAIFVLNLLLGWTFLGWVIALVWALTKDTPAAAVAG